MPPIPNRDQLSLEELPEFSFGGPFGGVQSELPPDLVEGMGFVDSPNILFRKSVASARPAFNTLVAIPNPQESLIGIGNFFTQNAVQISTVFTKTRLLKWNAPGWTAIGGGPAFTGLDINPFSTATVGYKLCFSNGVDKVMTWDGMAGAYALSSANAVAARYLLELDTHLLVADTVEGGVRFPQRIRWTGANDPTDWISFNAGIVDILNDLGPINGLCKLYQTGFAIHNRGISQVIPTGIGTAPFRFIPLTSKSRGTIAPYSLATFGEELAAYVGKDNVYAFDGSSTTPIGDSPVGDRRRMGARSRIFSDLAAGGPSNALGWVTTTINGNPFNAYWLVIPGISTWVYNFDEVNWTVFNYTKNISCLGDFLVGGVPRIIDLIGTISAQNWTPLTLGLLNPYESLFMGCTDGTPGITDFTGISEVAWSIKTGNLYFGDKRHTKNNKKVRLVVQDQGPVTYTIRATNNKGQTETDTITVGTGTGNTISSVLSFTLSGMWIQFIISGSAGAPGNIVEFAPIYNVGGEQRGGDVD